MKKLVLLLFTGLLMVLTGKLQAQDYWTVEVRPGMNLATGDLGNTSLDPGFGFEANIAYNFMEHLGVYGGWGWNKFASKDSDVELDFEQTGYTFGLQFIHPIGDSNLDYLIRGGGIYNHIEVENSDGDIIADSGHGLGWEVGVGLNLNIGQKLDLRPQIGYRTLTQDLKMGDTSTEVDMNYIALGLGVAVSF